MTTDLLARILECFFFVCCGFYVALIGFDVVGIPSIRKEEDPLKAAKLRDKFRKMGFGVMFGAITKLFVSMLR